MPRGLEGVREAAKEVEARRSQSGGPGVLWFRLQDGEEANHVRFLEQGDDVAWAWVHMIEVPQRQWGRPVACCDQQDDGTPCPGCEREIPRKFQGYINLIWQDAPVFKREENGRLLRDSSGATVVVGNKPQVAVWSSGIRLFEELEEIDTNMRGLSSRRFKVKRKGVRLATKYSISPEDIDSGPQDWTDLEKELAANKPDLAQFVQPKSYEDFLTELGEGQVNGGGQRAERPNPFIRNRS